MKKLALMLALTLTLSLTGCAKEAAAPETQAPAQTEAAPEAEAAAPEAEAPEAEEAAPEAAEEAAAPEVTDINDLYLFVDGADVTDGNVTYDSISDKFAEVDVNGIKYTGTTLTNLCAYDISTVVGVFAEAEDGFIRYYNSPADIHVVLTKAAGVSEYATVVPGQDPIVGISNIYMVTTPADFSVPVKVNGEEIGQITFSDFMKKTPVGDEKVTTAMYDGSFKYKGGEATYEGRFLGINYETMLAKLAALGFAVEGEVVELEVYGTPGMGAEGKNKEYALYPDEGSYFKNLEFFCMYDGMTNDPNIKGVDMGLSAFINGSGQKWVTYNISELNFITE